MTTERAAPSTEAGRALADKVFDGDAFITDADILAIEAEAARLALDGVRRAVEGLQAKAREVVTGHRERDFACRECNMTWPCHAWLLADEILRLATIEEASPVDLDELSPARASFTNGQT